MYSRITHTKDAKAALHYALGNGYGHNVQAERNIAVSSVGMLPDDVMSYNEQIDRQLSFRSKKNKTEAYRLVLSWSKSELDPDDKDAGNAAVAICQDMLDRYYHGFPAVICVQKDGKGGNVHAHIILINCNAETHKGLDTDSKNNHRNDQTKYYYLETASDTVSGEYVNIDYGYQMPTKDKTTQYERTMREKNAKGGEQVYIWKDDLKNRVRECMKDAMSREDFERLLIERGVEPEYHKPNKTHIDGYYTYILTDPKEPVKVDIHGLKARSYSLGDDYDIPALFESIELNRSIQKQQEHKQLQAEFDAFMSPTIKPKKQEQEEQEPQELPTAPAGPEPEPDYLFMQPNVQEDDDSASE